MCIDLISSYVTNDLANFIVFDFACRKENITLLGECELVNQLHQLCSKIYYPGIAMVHLLVQHLEHVYTFGEKRKKCQLLVGKVNYKTVNNFAKKNGYLYIMFDRR